MGSPVQIRVTAGFRHLNLYELDANALPIGTKVLEPFSPYTISSGSVISGSSVAITAGTTVSGSVGYYGAVHSGAKLLTITDPAPRVIPHIGDDGVMALQVLPPLEAITGELHVEKTNDTIDQLVGGGVLPVTIGESIFFGEGTNKRGFESSVGVIAYSAAEDSDPNSSLYGSVLWDSKIFPKVNLFMRETGYAQAENERLYTFTPMFCTAHLWGVQFTTLVDGMTRAQIVRGISQYKPLLVSFKGDGSTLGFPFDSARPAATTAKIAVFKNGVALTTGVAKTVSGIGFSTPPSSSDIISVWYETP
jgi:hypothetical protein